MARLRLHPRCPTRCQDGINRLRIKTACLGRANHGKTSVWHMDLNQVTLVHQCKRAAIHRLGSDVPNRRTLRRA